PERGQLFFGPLDDVDRGEDVASAFQRDSRFCAACHEGTVFGVPVYTTYSEWTESPAGRRGQSCQGCHLAPTGTLTNLAPGLGRAGARTDGGAGAAGVRGAGPGRSRGSVVCEGTERVRRIGAGPLLAGRPGRDRHAAAAGAG